MARRLQLGCRGFTLVEALVAIVLIGLGLLSAAPMFVSAMKDNAVGADLGSLGAVAVERMERLRELPFADPALAAGGSLTANVTTGGLDYFDVSDPTLTVRWLIQDNATPAGTKSVTVRVIAARRVIGMQKQVTLASLRGP